MQRLQPPHLVVQDARLHGAAATRVEAQHDRPRVRLLEGTAQPGHQVLGTRLAVDVDVAADEGLAECELGRRQENVT